MSSKVYEQATALTNRPDLKSETSTGIGLALAYYHSLEDWKNDVRTCSISTKIVEGRHVADLSKLDPKLRSLKSVHFKGKELTRDYGGGVECNTFTLGAGNVSAVLEPAHCSSSNKLTISYYSMPSYCLKDCSVTGSWLADAHPEVIASYAAAYVKSIIEDRTMRVPKMHNELLLRLYMED